MTVPYLFITILLFLVSRYFGGSFIRIARFWYLLFLLDFIALIINSASLRYSQSFTSKNVSKGEVIEYQLNISSWGLLPAPSVSLAFARIHQHDRKPIPPIEISIPPKSRWNFSKEIYAGLRGIYTMGLSELKITGFTRIISFSLPIWAKTFYVYPRLLRLELLLQKHLATAGDQRSLPGRGGEYHTIHGLREYRQGDSLRLISQKHFAELGKPIIRDFDSLGAAVIHLFLDRRPTGRNPICEDTAIETALALLYAACLHNQQMVIHGFPGWEGYTITSAEEIERLRNTTLLLAFDAGSAAELQEISQASTLYIISPLSDFLFLNQEFWENLRSGHLIAVTDQMDEQRRAQARSLMQQLTNEGAAISEIASQEYLEEELLSTFSS